MGPNSTPPQQENPRLQNLMLDVATVLHRALRLADYLSMTLKSHGHLDAETWPGLLPEGDIRRRVAWLVAEAGRRAIEGEIRESDIGLAQTKPDLFAHIDISDGLEALIPGSIACGEESSAREWNRALSRRGASEYRWVIDPIDGSSLQDTVQFGYASTTILYRMRGGEPARAVPVLMVTVTSSGLMLGWATGNTVAWAQMDVRDENLNRPLMHEVTEPAVTLDEVMKDRRSYVSVVAARSSQRKYIAPLLKPGSPWTVNTLGGAPAMSGLLLGKLPNLIVPFWQSRHDAAPLLALAAFPDILFLDAWTRRPYSADQISRFFHGIVRPNESNYLPIPPMVITRSAGLANELLDDFQIEWLEAIERRMQELTATGTGDRAERRLRVIGPDADHANESGQD